MTKEKWSKQTPASRQREAGFYPEFREDLRYWMQTNRQLALRALQLVEAIMHDPF